MAKNVVFQVDGQPVENVATFKYLGRWLSKDDCDLVAVKANINKARKR